MNKIYAIVAGTLILALIAYFYFKKMSQSEIEGKSNFFVSTASESQDRIKSLDLDRPSEDASYILDSSQLVVPKIEQREETSDYGSNPEQEWIINLVHPGGEIFKRNDLLEMFDQEWTKNYPYATVYGYSTNEKRWTFATAAGTPENYDKLQLGINLLDVYNEERPDYNPEKLRKYLTALMKKVQSHSGKLKIVQTEPVEKAVAKARKAVTLNHEFNQEAIIVLRSDQYYSGAQAWDALLSVGLNWGDGDLFHWDNHMEYGAEQHFSVWTSTDPGYFLPESIKDGQMHPKDLVFGFSIPRSADPEHVFNEMLKAVKYVQKRIGGTVLDQKERPLDEEKEKKMIADLVVKMKAKGMVPGANEVLRIF